MTIQNNSSNQALPDITSPADVKALDESQLPQLAEEVRKTLISSLSETGGHLGPNLGVVELSIALHRVFNTPEDKFLFDVSHQGYVHKMLTGRWKEIDSIRTYQGLNGFLLRTESEHDCYGAGHAGTAVSAALGMAVARDLAKTDDHVVCVAGDAAFTCGPTFEALNNISESTKKFILVLNDNEWSIDKNVGAIANYFNKISTNKTYAGLHDKAAELLEKIGGPNIRKIAGKVEEGAKNIISSNNESTLPSIIFEEFGLRYYGPIDGHDIPTLLRTFEFLKEQDEPVLLHIITEKGRGFQPALANPGKFHGLGQYNNTTGETAPGKQPTYSQIYAKTLTDLAKSDKQILAITAAMPGGTGLSVFKEELPERYFDVGIAEEHAALFACGLATKDFKPFLTIYSTFMQRAYDMLIHDVGIQNLPVRICMDRAGLSGDDGPTHHGLFDIGYLRHIPNWVFMQARNESEFVDMLWTMAQYNEGPIAIRYPRGEGPNLIKEENSAPNLIEIGKAEVVKDGDKVALFGLGNMFDLATEASEELESKGISTALINPRFIKPLDIKTIQEYAEKCDVICTLEDHVLKNGFGASIIECLHDLGITTPIVRIGWPDEFIEHGKVEILRDKHNVTSAHAVNSILEKLKS